MASEGMKLFRSLLFMKIVPNLRKLGLLTPRVREEFARMDVLKFESLSSTDEDVADSRSEERRVGKECGYQCRSRWSPYH